jgi:catechol 2,3-dioxygenase-like lactoylglutathione lyase family enzyme
MSLTLTLAVDDLARTAAFYREILGRELESFVPLPGHPPVLLLHLDEATILFRESAALEALHPALFQNLERHPRGVGMMLEFSTEDLGPTLRAIARFDLHVPYEIDDAQFCRREVWLHDPDGYLIVLSEEARGAEPGKPSKF